ncbi:MAG: hypothetical protein ACLP01_15470 [Solirubrobacteraceae bacterium]
MTLERDSIERRDFPVVERGYDPDAVGAHLAAIAGAVEELKLASHRRSEALASAAGEQVRTIIEAAESTAAGIERQAEDEARQIRAEALAKAEAARERAAAHGRDYVGKVADGTSAMLQQLDAMESELGAMIAGLRAGAGRLMNGLVALGASIGEVTGSAVSQAHLEREPGDPGARGPEHASEPAETPEVAAAPEPEPEREPESDAVLEPEPTIAPPDEPAVAMAEPVPTVAAPDEPVVAMAADEPGRTENEDVDGARLIALNMALSGTSREDAERYLAENFALRDRAALLDGVYASVES